MPFLCRMARHGVALELSDHQLFILWSTSFPNMICVRLFIPELNMKVDDSSTCIVIVDLPILEADAAIPMAAWRLEWRKPAEASIWTSSLGSYILILQSWVRTSLNPFYLAYMSNAVWRRTMCEEAGGILATPQLRASAAARFPA